jgi:hypothetical protein
MPPDEGFGLDEGKRLSPLGPDSGQNDPEGSVSVRQAGLSGAPMQKLDLMTQREVFQGQRPAGSHGWDKRAENSGYHGANDMERLSQAQMRQGGRSFQKEQEA